MADTIDIRSLVRDHDPFGPEQIKGLEKATRGPQVSDVRREISALQAEVESGSRSTPASYLAAGIGSYLLGQHERADAYLSRAKEGTANYYRGLALTALGRFAEAEKQFDAAEKAGHDPVDAVLRQAGAIREQGRLDEAEAKLRSVAKHAASRAEYSYQMGCILSDRGDAYGAIEYFERAVDMDSHHSQALFRLAAENALRGNDDEAVRLYEQSLSSPPLYLGALLNLGLLYEDMENYGAAAYCFRRVIEANPNHQRARLYLRDIEATSDMFYDEDSARDQARVTQLLGRPITDFELSVRSRNCLHAMGIHTLGNLTETTEQELLTGKNFGETSLHEIRDLMAAHGLHIGQNLQKKAGDLTATLQNLTPQEQVMLNKSIADMNLSVRARKCMSRLGITTMAELVQRTADELLSSRNFGVTSLNEVRSKLSEMNLKLRND